MVYRTPVPELDAQEIRHHWLGVLVGRLSPAARTGACRNPSSLRGGAALVGWRTGHAAGYRIRAPIHAIALLGDGPQFARLLGLALPCACGGDRFHTARLSAVPAATPWRD